MNFDWIVTSCSDSMTIQLARKLFTVTEYEQMIEAGIFGEDDRIE
jgi:hypothetical protein